MTRNEFYNQIIPNLFVDDKKLAPSGEDKIKVYENKEKDVGFIKKVTREKVRLNGSPILYFPIDIEDYEFQNNSLTGNDVLKDYENLKLKNPIDMIATWTPQEYQLDLSKWGVILPNGSDLQLYIHVDEIEEKLGRKPVIGDIIETKLDRMRYRVSDVYFGNPNLWENIFCMMTLTKVIYDNFTTQLDKYDDEYKDTYTKLEETLDLMDNSVAPKDNQNIKKKAKKLNKTKDKPKKRSLDTELDLMTMKL
jgi:hypothetical protein